MRMMTTLVLGFALVASAVGASAKTPLRDVSEIDDAMLWVALAIEISDKCNEIDPRTFKGLSVLYGLKNRAQELGYSNSEIKAYVKSHEEKARMRQRGEKYVKSRGLNPSDPAALCSLGHTEIDRSSKIGVLLKAK
ncbi:hypothetical protein PEL8287_01664 [Roseovarius litorisediminis]|uniref:NADH dehydrogenase subunit E n=1 Tax=Roseovarius litorisediminis TaxID=1312363 RepID=A0A1Y5S761_9RHOB|nr:DUF5333 domain-containing protein [Roseovarius litorisediminis]SLN34042.1 hypothetical protein PEL8287_01664 [Roseovarius litorisediminis]